jgi:hypothetical protein
MCGKIITSLRGRRGNLFEEFTDLVLSDIVPPALLFGLGNIRKDFMSLNVCLE